MNVRLATQEDWPSIKKLLRFTFSELRDNCGSDDIFDVASHVVARGIDTGEAVFVAEDHLGGLTGFVAWVGGVPGMPDDVAFGVGTYVLPKHRRSGLSERLRDAAMARCRELGYRRVRGEASNKNTAGIASCEKLGFQVVGVVVEKTL